LTRSWCEEPGEKLKGAKRSIQGVIRFSWSEAFSRESHGPEPDRYSQLMLTFAEEAVVQFAACAYLAKTLKVTD